MSNQVNGVITKIGFSGIRTGQYGETATCFVTINEETYSCNVKPYNGQLKLQTKQGDTYIDVKEGMQVIFNFVVNGTYKNFKSSEMFIVASGSNAQNPQQQPPAQQPTPTEKVPQNASKTPLSARIKLAGAEIMAYGFAIEKYGDNLPDNIEDLIGRKAKHILNQVK